MVLSRERLDSLAGLDGERGVMIEWGKENGGVAQRDRAMDLRTIGCRFESDRPRISFYTSGDILPPLFCQLLLPFLRQSLGPSTLFYTSAYHTAYTDLS